MHCEDTSQWCFACNSLIQICLHVGFESTLAKVGCQSFGSRGEASMNHVTEQAKIFRSTSATGSDLR